MFLQPLKLEDTVNKIGQLYKLKIDFNWAEVLNMSLRSCSGSDTYTDNHAASLRHTSAYQQQDPQLLHRN